MNDVNSVKVGDLDSYLAFALTNEQCDEFKEWERTLPPIKSATIGGVYTFSFTPTGLGVVCKVHRCDGNIIDLTDYDKW